MTKVKKPSFIALFPILFFLGATLFFGLTLESSQIVDPMVLFMIASLISIFMFTDTPTMDKVDIFAKEAANPNIIIMVVIFLLAGAFSSVAKSSGGVDSVVNLFLTYVPNSLLVSGVFMIACFIGVSLGTSVGTVVALAPIAVGLAETTGLPVAMVIGAALGGAAFGDNLSVISDTTIAATRICGVSLKDKFKLNALIVIPIAILTMIIFSITTRGIEFSFVAGEYNLMQVAPFILVLVAALSGINVFYVLLIGIVFSGAVGIFSGTFSCVHGHSQFIAFLETFQAGMMSMAKISIIVILVAGIIGMIKYNGGIKWITDRLEARITSGKGGMLSIAFLTIIITIFVANSTVGIVTTGPIALETGEKYNLDNRKIATYLGIFATSTMANVPWGGMMLAAASAASASMTTGNVEAIDIIKYSTYSHLVIIFSLICIYFNVPKLKNEKFTKQQG